MKLPFPIVSLCLIVGMGVGPGPVLGAQLLTDSDMDQVTAAGASFSMEILPSNVQMPTIPPMPDLSTSNALKSAQAALNAAQAAALAADAYNGIGSLPVAEHAVTTASKALETVAQHHGVPALNSGSDSVTAAKGLLQTVPPADQTPQIRSASEGLKNADLALNLAAIQTGGLSINAALEAVNAAKKAVQAVEKIQGNQQVDAKPAFSAVLKSIEAAKQAVDVASQATGSSAQGTPSQLTIDPNVDPSDIPIVKFAFETGRSKGSGEAIPLIDPVANSTSQPSFNFNGQTLLQGNYFKVDNMILNMNICNQCKATEITQTGLGYVFPIYVR